MYLNYKSILDNFLFIYLSTLLISYLNVFASVSILIIFHIIYLFIPTVLTKPSEFGSEIENEKLKSVIDRFESSPFVARYWSNQYGGFIRRYGRPNIYLLPKDLDEADSVCSIAHEIGHYTKEHHARRVLIGCASVVTISIVVSSFKSFFPLLLIFCSLIREIVLNYFNHKYEYQADSVASNITSNDHVVKRLQSLGELDNAPSIPYINEYPRTGSRISRLVTD